MNKYFDMDMKEEIPAVVEKRLQDAYEMIRRGEAKKAATPKMQKRSYRHLAGMAAAAALVIAVPSVMYAAVTYFQRNVHQTSDSIAYEFRLNYELVPGEYKVSPGYLPDGMAFDEKSGKYKKGSSYISVIPVYTMSELERMNKKIVINNIENVEHTVLSGMTADIITFREAEKYQTDTNIFLFNEKDGYVLEIAADYDIEKGELLKFADNLSVEKTSNGNYMTNDEMLKKQQDEILSQKSEKTWGQLLAMGIPQNKIYQKGQEMICDNGAAGSDRHVYGYTVTDYEFLNGISGFDEKYFYDYASFNNWLNADKTLKPYTRQEYDKEGKLTAEKLTEQELLRVTVKVRNYSENSKYVPLNFNLEYVEQVANNAYTWSEAVYASVPKENYSLQMDNCAVYCDSAVNTKDSRKEFFFREMKPGEELTYTLLFVVDKDREGDFMMYPDGSNTELNNTEALTAREVVDALEGYISLR